jgi:hypothetical protein
LALIEGELHRNATRQCAALLADAYGLNYT